MARPRKPTAVLALVGALKHNRKRYVDRAREPKPEAGLGEPPAHLNEAQQARWRDLVLVCAPGVLTKQDRVAAEVLSVLWQEFRDGKMTNPRLMVLNSLFGRFGLTPADRSKVVAQEPRSEGDRAEAYFAS